MEQIPLQRALQRELAAGFRRRFGREPAAGARAPGRVNLIGEHTDYNEGLVLPCAIDRDTVVLVAARRDRQVRVFSRERGAAELREADRSGRRGDWLDYLRGVLDALRAAGAGVGGLDLAVASRVPAEAGLSSSAALCVGLVTAIDACAGLGLDAENRARIAHRAESEFAGVGCGIMDHFASSLGRRGAALRIDCRSLEVRPVPLSPERLALLVAHSGTTRSLARGGYSGRRAECARALEAARRAGLVAAGAALRDLAPGELPALERVLDPAAFRRARHVVTENARVEAACAALAAGDLAGAGALLREGMQSLRRDFEVSTPELDALCRIADAAPGVYGSRLTGAGFGGCTLHLVAPEAAEAAARAIADGFEREFGRRPPLWQVAAAEGASRLENY